jgi:NAD(P)H dehydrogenase (quinone)
MAAETTLFSIIPTSCIGMIVVGLNYGFAGQMRLDEITGGSPYGTPPSPAAMTAAPSANELEGACYQGPRDRGDRQKLHG